MRLEDQVDRHARDRIQRFAGSSSCTTGSGSGRRPSTPGVNAATTRADGVGEEGREELADQARGGDELTECIGQLGGATLELPRPRLVDAAVRRVDEVAHHPDRAPEVEVDERGVDLGTARPVVAIRKAVGEPGGVPSASRCTIVTMRWTRFPTPCARSSSDRVTTRSMVKSASTVRGTSRSNHQRSASVPTSSTTATGSIELPADFESFSPPAVR